MKRLFSLLLLPLLLLSGVVSALGREQPAGTRTPIAPAGDTCPDTRGPNLLVNPSFEGQYSAYIPSNGHPDCPAGICNTAQMAPDWVPWWRSHNPADPDWIIRMPEWKPADPQFTNPPRVRTGEAAQQYFTFFSTHEAGFYQQVAVTAGESYCFSIWGHSWSADDDDDAYSGPDDGILLQKIGIDPTGGTDWQSANIVWSEARTQYDEYGLFEVVAEAQANTITVYVYSQPAFAVKHNDVYWDDAALQATTPAVTIGPPGGYAYVVDMDLPHVITDTFTIDYPGDPPPLWMVTLDPAGTLTPTLSTPGGAAGDSLTFTIVTAPYSLGYYTTTLLITTNPPIAPEPFTVPIRLYIFQEVHDSYLPALYRE